MTTGEGLGEVLIRDATQADHKRIVALNASQVQHTSPMDLARLGQLDALACYHKVAVVDGQVGAFLLSMASGCGYRNENFAWFSERLSDFLYIDRIVVDARHQGAGLGRRLYGDLFDYVRHLGLAVVACEYNVVPSNNPSRAFHRKLGFRELGSEWVGGGAKKVSFQIADVRGAEGGPIESLHN